MAADVADDIAQLAHETVDHDRRQLQLEESLGHLLAHFLRLLVARAGLLRGLLELAVQAAQLVHAARHFDGIRTRVDRIGVLAVGAFLLVLLDDFFFEFRFERLLVDLKARHFHVEKAGQHFRQALLAFGVLIVFLEQQLDRPREIRERTLDLVQAFFDALGDGDFALAREQFHGTHLAHVHAHGVGGAAHFGVHGRQHGDGFFRRGFVVDGRDRRFRQQRLGIGRNLVHLDTHVVDHADDVFDLFRIDDVVGQVVVDFGVGQIALFFALDDQGLDFGLLLLDGLFDGHEI